MGKIFSSVYYSLDVGVIVKQMLRVFKTVNSDLQNFETQQYVRQGVSCHRRDNEIALYKLLNRHAKKTKQGLSD